MSLDTVLKIGNILRNSKEKMSFSNAVASCPKDNKGCWPFCLCLPVDKDFNIIFDKASIVPENKRNSLYYLMYKTSTSDSVCRYIYGDIYYSFKGTLGKNGSINKPVEGGNYRLMESPSSFDKGTATCNEICSLSGFSPEGTNEFQRMRTGFAKEQTLIERILKYAPAIIKYFENVNVSSFKEYIENEDNLKNICCTINKENNKKKLEKLSEAKGEEELLLLNSASIFLHFSYEDGNGDEKSWYDFFNTLELVIREMHKKYVEDVKGNKERLVLKKSRWPTICSGDEKNDIQFPNFDLGNRYIIRKTKRFAIPERAVYFLKTKRTAGVLPHPKNFRPAYAGIHIMQERSPDTIRTPFFSFCRFAPAFRASRYAASLNALYAATLRALTSLPRKARREPTNESAFEASLLAYAYDTPPNALASLYPR